MRTLLLDQSAWDLVIDAQGNIAVADDPYASAQDAASAVRTFAGEVYYDTSLGVPFFAQMLGRFPPAQLVKAAMVKAAKTVPGVTAAACFLRAVAGRQITGQVQVTTAAGETAAVGALTEPLMPGQLNFSDLQQSGWL